MDRWTDRQAGTHQVLKHQCQALVSVDDVVEGDDVGVLQVLEERHCREKEKQKETAHALVHNICVFVSGKKKTLYFQTLFRNTIPISFV